MKKLAAIEFAGSHNGGVKSVGINSAQRAPVCLREPFFGRSIAKRLRLTAHTHRGKTGGAHPRRG